MFADGMRREYLLVRAPQKSWGAALSYCRQEGFGTSGELVQIKTQQQHDFLFNHVVDWYLPILIDLLIVRRLFLCPDR